MLGCIWRARSSVEPVYTILSPFSIDVRFRRRFQKDLIDSSDTMINCFTILPSEALFESLLQTKTETVAPVRKVPSKSADVCKRHWYQLGKNLSGLGHSLRSLISP